MNGNIHSYLRHLIILLCAMQTLVFGGNTGKIVGRIVDGSTDEPLFGANVVILGTEWGASSGEDGHFFINNIPPGAYTLRATMIGYRGEDILEVLVKTDLTTDIVITLQFSTIEGEIVTVVAERRLVNKDITAKQSIMSGADMAEKAPMTTVNDALTTQAGFVEGEDGSLHLRGGRSGEVSYYVDGILVKDPIGGGLGAGIDINSVSEMSILTGGFNAEYGEAMSGIVNITTKDGGNKLEGKFQYESDIVNSSPYHISDWLLESNMVDGLTETEKQDYLDAVRYYSSVEDTVGQSQYQHVSVLDHDYAEGKLLIPALGRFSGNLSGPLPMTKKMTFFVSGFHNNHDSYLPSGFTIENQLMGKLSYKLTNSSSLSFIAQTTSNYFMGYSHYYKYIPPVTNDTSDVINYNTRLLGHQDLTTTKTQRQVVTWKQAVSSKTFYTLHFQRLFRTGEQNIPGINVPYDPDTGVLLDTVTTEYTKLQYIFGTESDFRGGDARNWYREETTTLNLKGDLTSQLTLAHQLKTGFDLKQHTLFRHAIADPWPGAFRHRPEFYERTPQEAAFYIQDKMEFDFMVLNLGIRFDALKVNDEYFEDVGDIQETVTVDNGDGTTTSEFQFKELKEVPLRYKFSPRIGLAHVVTDKLVFHFSYGHFFQNPDFYYLYRNDNAVANLAESDVIIGNPGLKPQKTVAFEVGGKYQINENLALDFSGFYKDIRDLTSTKYYSRQPYNYTIYINEDYARVKGFDVSLKHRIGRLINSSAHYTYSVAQGSGSDPLAGYYFREGDANLRPIREFYLDFDRTHDFSANIDLRFPSNYRVKMLSNFGANLLFQLASGLPYTPSYSGALSIETNSERKGNTNTLDLRLDRTFNLGDTKFVVFLKGTNILDNLNVRYVWSETGDPWWAGPANYRSYDRQANPANVGPRRDIRLGMYIKF
ncbi:MAG: TonB-dependent receptor [Candidatus Marinimicrobia bacterium]|nr:TonB-dependent receptor [Candidatus Neomarinimicrobiota bacterium]